jgi:hypothetical protein
MAKSRKRRPTFDWAASDERLHAACVAALERFAAGHAGEAVCFFALYAEPLYGDVRIALDTLANNVRVVQEREAAAVAAREAQLRRADAWKGVESGMIHPLNRPIPSAFNTDRKDFAYPDYARERFPEWEDVETWPELDDYYPYLEPNVLLVLWRVAERLVAERAFAALELASPFMVGYGVHDDEAKVWRQNILRLLNWPAGAYLALPPTGHANDGLRPTRQAEAAPGPRDQAVKSSAADELRRGRREPGSNRGVPAIRYRHLALRDREPVLRDRRRALRDRRRLAE